MNTKSKRGWLLLVALFWLGLETAGATTFLQLQSTCLGGGWFQYQMKVFDDPFFVEADIVQLQIGFTNEIDHSTSPADWTNSDWGISDYGYPYSDWSFSSSSPPRPYEETFLIRSSARFEFLHHRYRRPRCCCYCYRNSEAAHSRA